MNPNFIIAGELLGKTLKFSNFSGIINEVEAYICRDDTACHVAKAYTKRTSVMLGKPGFSCVYFIYGIPLPKCYNRRRIARCSANTWFKAR